MTETSFSPRVFSGIKPSGGLTLGNYLGALPGYFYMTLTVKLNMLNISVPAAA